VDNPLANAAHDCGLGLFQRSRGCRGVARSKGVFRLAYCGPDLALAVLVDGRAAGGLADPLFSGSVTGHGLFFTSGF
jgi:hypothetical protein